MQHIIIANYGNESLALVQWCIEQCLTKVIVINVDTGWANAAWRTRVQRAQHYVRAHGLEVLELTSPMSFAELVVQRNAFPSKKFQWCAGFLKGVAINQYLDEIDPGCDAQILLAKRRSASRSNFNLAEYIETSEHYNDRKIWHPLINHDVTARDQLINNAGFAILSHASRECSPCIHDRGVDLQALPANEIKKVSDLEQQIQQPMFAPNDFGQQPAIKKVIIWLAEQPTTDLAEFTEMYDFGCGSVWGCGE